jgi:hypothetical protein
MVGGHDGGCEIPIHRQVNPRSIIVRVFWLGYCKVLIKIQKMVHVARRKGDDML